MTSTTPADFLAAVSECRQAGDLDAAMDLCRARLAQQPADLVALNALGRLQHMHGDLAAARDTLTRAFKLNPAYPPVASALVQVLTALGHAPAALDVLRTLALARPDDVPVQRHAGAALFRAGDYASAATCFERWCATQAADADALTSLGSCVQMLGQLDRAESLYRQALEADPSRADVWSNLGTLNQGRKNLAAAHDAYTRALALDERNGEARAGLAAVLEMRGAGDEALALLRGREDEVARNTEMTRVLARLARRAGDAAAAQSAVTRRLGAGQLSRAESSRLEFSLGDSLDAQQRYAEAFTHYARANAVKGVRFDAAAHRAFVDQVCRVHGETAVASEPLAAVTPAPLFIVGMPRSGTSLIEQMLACHSSIHAAGERRELPAAISMLVPDNAAAPYPDSFSGLSIAQREAAAQRYRGQLWSDAGDVAYVTDKLPGNFVYLGAIPLLFSNARVIHCGRDPLDVGLSLFCHDFAFSSLPFSYSLDGIGHYYRDYRRLMAHWRKVRPLPMLDVNYEEVVADPQNQIRRVLDFLGLKFEASVLDFHRSERVAFTASNDQVRKPVYGTSVGRWRHYQEQLAPLRAMLSSDADDD